MKRFLLVLLGLMLLFPNAGSAGAAANAQLSPDLQKAIAAAVAKELTKYGAAQPVPGAAIGVWVPGKGEFVRGIGFARLSPPAGMSRDDLFRIGSNTKTFVATVLLQLVDENKLRLDDTIARFDLGLAVPNEKTITLRQLAEMRSGIIDMYSVPGVQEEGMAVWGRRTPRQWVALAAKQPPLFAPGAKYNYSNTNWFLLGLIIEKVTHHTIEAEIRDRILVPMSLSRTSFPTTNWGMPTPYAHGYSLNAKKQWVGRVRSPPALRFLGGRSHDFKHDGYEEVGKSLCDRNDEWRGDSKRAACMFAYRRREPRFRLGNWLFRRVVRLYGRHNRLQYRSLLYASYRRDDRRLHQQPAREAVPWGSQCDLSRHRVDHNAEQRTVYEIGTPPL